MRENDLIKRALSENVTDKDYIYRRIVLSATQPTKRRHSMKKVIMIAAAIALLSVTAFASVRLLTPREVAEDLVFTDQSGATHDHFATPFTFDDSVEIGESRTDAGLKITFMGFAHGQGIDVSDLAVDKNKTYAVIAVENENGTPIEVVDTMLTVSPLVKGMNPGLHNGFTFGMSGMATVIEGVQYQLMELEVIEYFAENHLYLSVCDSVPSIGVYLFDEQSGEITANPDYEGVNVLFDLPIDPAKADSARVDEYMAKYENPDQDENSSEGEQEYFLEMSIEEADAKGELIFEDVVSANSDGDYAIYWNDTNIFTTMPGEDLMMLEIGTPRLWAVGGDNQTSKMLFIQRISQTEVKTSVYEVSNTELNLN